MRRAITLVVAAAMAVTVLAVPASASGGGDHWNRTYKVTITNLTDTQLTTPFVVATHSSRFNLFRRGRTASDGLQQLAENGGVPVLVDELDGKRRVSDVGVAGGAPVGPGESVEVYVSADWWAWRVSLAGMLICTNDGFGGINKARLPWFGQKTYYGRSYDAGTEINTEAYADLVPPCDGQGQSGMTNPDLAENGVVHRHQNIQGGADLTPDAHGWDEPVIKVTVQRVFGG